MQEGEEEEEEEEAGTWFRQRFCGKHSLRRVVLWTGSTSMRWSNCRLRYNASTKTYQLTTTLCLL